jgi:hypothetical protein
MILNDAKKLYDELCFKTGETTKDFSFGQYSEVKNLLDRIDKLPLKDQGETADYKDWFSKFESLYRTTSAETINRNALAIFRKLGAPTPSHNYTAEELQSIKGIVGRITLHPESVSPELKEFQKRYVGNLIATESFEKALHEAHTSFYASEQAANAARMFERNTRVENALAATPPVKTDSLASHRQTLASPTIYVSQGLPPKFYEGLKQALIKDKHAKNPNVKFSELNTPECKKFIQNVKDNPSNFGIQCQFDLEALLSLTLNQIGAMVVKTDLTEDPIRRIDVCAVPNEGHRGNNTTIMRSAFQSVLQSAENGMVIFPAIGLEAQGGDPDLFWNTLIDAIVSSGRNVEKIFINPRHRATPGKSFQNATGEEFQKILDQRRAKYEKQQDRKALDNLAKIKNLSGENADLVQLAHNLKKEFPESVVALVNDSDPNGLCFQETPSQILQIPAGGASHQLTPTTVA